jgi:charged multivesicular body protein 4
MQLFFPRQKPKANAKDAIVRLRDTLQMLEKRETHLQTKIDTELKNAKSNAATNKRGNVKMTTIINKKKYILINIFLKKTVIKSRLIALIFLFLMIFF